jgi:hypothetical protein
MAHPLQSHREHHVKRERVHSLYGHHEGHRDYEDTYHRARGGHVSHPDEKEDKKVVREMVKGEALKHGHKAHQRADKRARGGKVKHKGKTVVNVNVAPQQAPPHPMPMPPPAAAAPPPRPPMPPPGAGGPPGAPPGMPPGGMPMRAKGGPVFSEHIGKMGPTGKGSAKGKNMLTTKVKDFSEKGPMGPYASREAGGGGGNSRMQKNNRAATNYHRGEPGISNPGMKEASGRPPRVDHNPGWS